MRGPTGRVRQLLAVVLPAAATWLCAPLGASAACPVTSPGCGTSPTAGVTPLHLSLPGRVSVTLPPLPSLPVSRLPIAPQPARAGPGGSSGPNVTSPAAPAANATSGASPQPRATARPVVELPVAPPTDLIAVTSRAFGPMSGLVVGEGPTIWCPLLCLNALMVLVVMRAVRTFRAAAPGATR